MSAIEQLTRNVARAIWKIDSSDLPWWKAWPLWLLRTGFVLTREAMEGQLNLRAMSLVFTTLLSMVPLLAVSFSVLKAFGVHNQAEPILLGLFEPLGERGMEVTSQVIGFVDNIKVGVLGSLGIGLLIYTVVSLIQKVESAFNYTWRVGQTRSFARRFSTYLSTIIIGPVLLFTALGLMATLMNSSAVQFIVSIEPFGSLYRVIGLMVPTLLIIAAFTFAYAFIPNTSVKLGAALTGGVVAGLLWNLTGKVFATFIVASTNYTAIYSSFAIILFAMMWLYISWLIVLIGASVAFYQQHPEYLDAERRGNTLSNRSKERLALLIMSLIGENFYNNRPPWSLDAMARRLQVSADALEILLKDLEGGGLLVQTDTDPPTYVPAQPLETTTVKRVLDLVRSADDGFLLNIAANTRVGDVDEIINKIDHAVEEALGGQTVKDLGLLKPEISVASIEPYQQQANQDVGRRDR